MSIPYFSLHGYPLRSSGYRAFVGFRPVWEFWGHWINPATYWRAIKYFCQRGWRGYAECDHWSADAYMEHVMLGLLRDVQEYKNGYPCGPHTQHVPFEESAEEDPGLKWWDGVMAEIITGLEASQELSDEDTVPKGTYSDEPIAWERVEGKDGLWQMKDTETPRFNSELYESWAEPLRQKRKRAALLMVKHWGDFWT